MKRMTCNQLGGACDMEFHADSFDEMARLSQAHGREMHEEGDEAHLEAMSQMTEMMKDPEAMKEWMDGKREEFDALPDSE